MVGGTLGKVKGIIQGIHQLGHGDVACWPAQDIPSPNTPVALDQTRGT